MSLVVSAAEANRGFSGLLGEVKAGRGCTITSHGRPVARMVPIRAGSDVTDAARSALFGRLKNARLTKTGAWTRDDLYEDGR